MQHIIIYGKDGDQQRFRLASELLHDLVPNSKLSEAKVLKDLEITESDSYCLHLICSWK